MKPNKESGKILEDYVKLTRKLGKFPTVKDVVRYITSERQLYTHFEKFADLKELALETHPELEGLIVPAKLAIDDIETFRFKQEKSKVVNANKDLISKVNTLEYLAKFADNVFVNQIIPVKPMTAKKPIERALNLTLSDLHFGADITKEETGYLDYGRKEEARRFAEVVKQVIDYKPHYRKETELRVNLLGDIIQHKLHDAQAAAPVSEQICRSIHLLSQGFAQLGENFPKVTVYCSTGNHGRDLNRHSKRATSGKWDSVETVIYFALRKILAQYKNIKFVIPKTPYIIYEVFGHKVFATHGDTVLNVGNPGKSLNIKNIENQINQINASMNDKDEIKVVIVGHTHCSSVSNLNSGTTLITNGALPPTDDYAVSLGYLENRSSQTLTETTEEHAVGDIRFIRVDGETDKNEKLDAIIKPYGGFDEE